ncbi:TIGR02594 family protein [Acinetobacter populi]|uniref:TIGR02594 family protein n=1 Tax=Acinetobacter populi TaxID=1582270 RepID=A0A1Z9YZI1_9GAMM|nr:TIGR02594 family protein [Acinetobacter populi]OUY07633.1 TIGR02594 family protein [Acinetobacter populi]
MNLINESIWKFKSTQWSAIATLFISIFVLVLQFTLDAKLLPSGYESIASAILVFIAGAAGKKVYQPELHAPDLNQFATIQPLVSAPVSSNDLAWMVEAKKHIGLKENTSKTAHNPTILSWLISLGAWWSEDETPWCGVFVAWCLKQAGVAYPKHWYRALAYAEGGAKLLKPAYGCVAIKTRSGGGHVCFVTGKTKDGKLVCIGGNQNNMVSYALYNQSDFQEFRWYGKTSRPADSRYNLPILNNVTATKVSEA